MGGLLPPQPPTFPCGAPSGKAFGKRPTWGCRPKPGLPGAPAPSKATQPQGLRPPYPNPNYLGLLQYGFITIYIYII